MSFQNKNLSVIAYANGFTLWHYVASEAVADITSCGFFNPVHTLMNIGDIVIINARDDTILRKIAQTADNVTVGAIA